MESWVQSWQPRANAFCDFSNPPVESIAPATKKWCQVIRRAAPVTQNHLSKPEDLMLQNATPLRNSPPGLPNSSDEYVSCTAPATENASLQILFKCPTPAIIFDFEMCFAPQRRALFPKVVRSWCGLYILTWKCTSRHNGVHFFDISTSKSGPDLVCFVHCDLEMCFAPQRRALFRHLNFQKWSGHCVVCTFSLRNVLRATTACTFSSLIWPDGSAPAALASLLFDPPEPQTIGKTQFFATFLPFRAPVSSYFWLFLFYSLLIFSLLSASAHLCFSSVHIVGSLTSKLPSIIYLYMYICISHLYSIYVPLMFIYIRVFYFFGQRKRISVQTGTSIVSSWRSKKVFRTTTLQDCLSWLLEGLSSCRRASGTALPWCFWRTRNVLWSGQQHEEKPRNLAMVVRA